MCLTLRGSFYHSKNRDRLNDNAVASEFSREVVRLAEHRGLMSEEHFSVDGTLLQAWASHKSFQPKDAPPPGPVRTVPRNARRRTSMGKTPMLPPAIRTRGCTARATLAHS